MSDAFDDTTTVSPSSVPASTGKKLFGHDVPEDEEEEYELPLPRPKREIVLEGVIVVFERATLLPLPIGEAEEE